MERFNQEAQGLYFVDLTNWLLGVILGVVQGVSEWLPISSKTQVILASNFLFGLNFKTAYALGLFLEAGTFIAALYYFRRQVWKVLQALVGRGDEEARLLLRFLVVVTLFTALVGVVIYKTVSETVSGPILGVPMMALGCVLIGDGVLMWIAKGRFAPTKRLGDLTLTDLVIVGVVQGIAALPGVSRSGVTVSAMLLLGINPQDSFKLSFLALIPASIGAAGVSVLLSPDQISAATSAAGVPVIALTVLVSIAIGIAFIGLLLRIAGSSRIALLAMVLGVIAIFSGIASFLVGHG